VAGVENYGGKERSCQRCINNVCVARRQSQIPWKELLEMGEKSVARALAKE